MNRPAAPSFAVIFDLDGLLSDTEPLWRESARRLLARRGIEPDPALLPRVMGRPTQVVAAIFVEHYGLDESAEALVDERLELHREVCAERGAQPMPGAVALVRALEREGTPLAVASGSPGWLIAAVLERLGLRDAFTVLVGSDSGAAGKPAPDLFMRAARELGVDPRNCVVLEDSANGVEAAGAAGMACVAVPSPEIPLERVRGATLCVSTLETITPKQLRALRREATR